MWNGTDREGQEKNYNGKNDEGRAFVDRRRVKLLGRAKTCSRDNVRSKIRNTSI